MTKVVFPLILMNSLYRNITVEPWVTFIIREIFLHVHADRSGKQSDMMFCFSLLLPFSFSLLCPLSWYDVSRKLCILWWNCGQHFHIPPIFWGFFSSPTGGGSLSGELLERNTPLTLSQTRRMSNLLAC